MKELHWTLCKLETKHPEAAFIVAGDFNKAHLRTIIPSTSILIAIRSATATLTSTIHTKPSPALFTVDVETGQRNSA
jgi:hypothetical protein